VKNQIKLIRKKMGFKKYNYNNYMASDDIKFEIPDYLRIAFLNRKYANV
jgi:hypothetical protein